MNNNFESPKPESAKNEFEQYEDLIKQYEDSNAQEDAMEKVACGIHIEEFEAILEPLLEEKLLANLNAIKTEEEAQNSAERDSVKKALIPLEKKLRFVKVRTDITAEEYEELHERYKTISRAVGMINSGVVDHNR